MIGIPMYTTILTLHKQGNSQRQIARSTGHDRKTVKRIIGRFISANIELPPIIQRDNKIQVWHKEIVTLLESNLSYVRIKEELNSQGFIGSYSSLTRYIKKITLTNNICIKFFVCIRAINKSLEEVNGY